MSLSVIRKEMTRLKESGIRSEEDLNMEVSRKM